MSDPDEKPDVIRHFGGTAMRMDYFEDVFRVWKSLPDEKRRNSHYVSRKFGISVKKAATDFIPQLYDRLSEEDPGIAIPAEFTEKPTEKLPLSQEQAMRTIHLGKNTKTVPVKPAPVKPEPETTPKEKKPVLEKTQRIKLNENLSKEDFQRAKEIYAASEKKNPGINLDTPEFRMFLVRKLENPEDDSDFEPADKPDFDFEPADKLDFDDDGEEKS